MTDNLIERLSAEWANLDPVDPLRGLIRDAIAALSEARAAIERQSVQEAEHTKHLGEIYDYLCSTSPKGYANEAFRNVPDSLLPDSVRNQVPEQWASPGEDARAIPEHVGSQESTHGRDGKTVAAPQPQPVPPEGPMAETVEQAARDVAKCLNERDGQGLDLRHVAMLVHYAQQPVQQGPVAAQQRFRHPQKTMPDWSPWQPCKVADRPAWQLDSQGYEVEYRALYTSPQIQGEKQ